MVPWKQLGRAKLPAGELVLSQRGDEFVLRIAGVELMNSRSHNSEAQLAVLGCAQLTATPGARVLVGGLGMGFTLRSALSTLPADAHVIVCELIAEVVEWNRGPLADLAARPLEDPRVELRTADVSRSIAAGASAPFGAILLDVDNGPGAFTAPGNAALYGVDGLQSVRRALVPGGALAVWSVEDDQKFSGRLTAVGFRVAKHRVPARLGGGAHHTLWVARTGTGAP